MNIYFNSLFKTPLYFIPRQMQLSSQQTLIAKISLAIFSALCTIYFCLKLDELRQRVTVIEKEGSSYSTHIKNVNGHCRVIFNGFFASNATVEGEFLHGQLNGMGKIRFPSGAIVQEEGEFEKGWLRTGKMSYRDGKLEQGEFNKGCLEGKGERIYPDGKKEEGAFKSGKFIGK